MAATFKNVGIVLNDTSTTVYTVPAATTAIVIGCQITNVGATANFVDFWWTDDSNADAQTYLADGIVIPLAASYEPIGGKLVLEAGDTIQGLSETDDELEVSVSVLELT